MSYNYLDHDNDTLNFGKFTSRTYKDVYENEKKYTKWALSQVMTQNTHMKLFQQYAALRNDAETDTEKPFIRDSITRASSIYEMMTNSIKHKFDKYMLNVDEHDFNKDYKKEWKWQGINDEDNSNFSLLHQLRPDEQGIFCDYFIRHQIAKKLNIPLIDNRAEQHKNILGEAYEHYKNKVATPMEIYLTSTAHSMSFGNKLSEIKVPFPDDFTFKGVEEWIEDEVGGRQKVELDPALGNRELMLSADSDLILDEMEIVEIKYVNSIDVKRTFIQLLIYAACYKIKNDKYIETLTVMNFKNLKTVFWIIPKEAIDEMITVLKDSIKSISSHN